jgi:hypothetical protein
MTRTRRFSDILSDYLHDPENARVYLIAAFDEYRTSGDDRLLAKAMQAVIEAQGGVDRLLQTVAAPPSDNGKRPRRSRRLEDFLTGYKLALTNA